MTLHNLFTAGPANLYANPDNAITLGTEFRVNTACWATQIRWFRASGAGEGIRRGAIYWVNTGGLTGTLVYGPVALPAGVDGQWVPLDIPALRLDPGSYRVAIWHPSPGLYVATANYFSTGTGGTNTTRGPITIPNAASALGQKQGSYTNGEAMAFPASVYNAGGYFSDITISDTNPNPPQGIAVKVREAEAWVSRTARPKVFQDGQWKPAPLKRWTGTNWQ